MVKIAVLDDYLQIAQRLAAWDSLPDIPEVRFYHDRGPTFEMYAERLAEVEVISTVRERTPLPAELLARASALRMICVTGGAPANLDMRAATARGIVVSAAAGAGNSTVELTWALILGLVRSVPQEDAALRTGVWQTRPGYGVEGKTLGILGLGRIGSRVAAVGRAFGMQIVAAGVTLTQERANQNGAEMLTIPELMTRADVITIHWRLNDLTRGRIGAAELSLMKPSAYLVNTSRGPIVDEAALIETLRQGRIAGAALDVYDQEPLRLGHPLLSLPNVVLTPHLGYASMEALEAFYKGTVENIRNFLLGRPSNVLNPEVLEGQASR